MANFNSVVVVGRLTCDPELRYAPSGSPVCSFRLSAPRPFTNEAGKKVEQVTFVEIEVWRRLAEICAQFLKAGREILVMGTLRESRWTDPKTQESRSTLKVVARDVQFLWRAKKTESEVPEGDGDESDE